ncbi:MAG: urate hydroxylase PuuD [Hyphomicrobiaceae bacterium]|nr:urate hydroxylase PuuD [Hyphomicrobiaceae bacterium]
METFLLDWSNLLLRWAHLILGIGWIGTSFYFIGLDVSLRKREGLPADVYGSSWQVHGGGFYDVRKYTVAPSQLPPDLIWFKWEAYLTWVTGFALIVVQYYFNATAYLIDPGKLALTPAMAIGISVVSLGLGWLVYNGLCRSPLGASQPALMSVLFVIVLGAAWGYTHVYSGRGALIHVGALVGTWMAFNVFMIIVPNQKKIVASLLKGEAPDARLGAIGKQRSVHNTYLTLPVILMMVSNHYPMLTNHPHSWLLVGLVLVIGALVRHFIVRHEAGDAMGKIAWTLPVAAVALLAAMVLTAPRVDPAMAGLKVSDAEVLAIAQKHCVQCHAAKPTHEGFSEAPKGVVFASPADIRRYGPLVLQQAVQSDAMPLGNETGISDAERRQLGAWLLK